MILQAMNKKEEEVAKNIEESILKYRQLFGGIKMSTSTHLSTGNEMLNEILCGGYKKGTLTEISGESDSGKTLLALKAIKQAEKEHKLSLYISCNNVINISMLSDNNINPDNVSVLYMNTADVIGPLLSQMIKPIIDSIGVIIIDSLADLTTTKEQSSSLKASTEIGRSKIIKALLTRLANIVRNTDACVLILNQERTNIVDNESQGNVSTSERWIDMSCDTRIRLSKDEDGDSCVEVRFKERKL